MTIGSVGNSSTYSPASLHASAAVSVKTEEGNQAADKTSIGKAAQTAVSISEEAKRQQAAEAGTQATKADGTTETEAAGMAESFTYGALGMDHPDEVKSNTDDFYTAGQVLSAIGTVGTLLLAVV